jgi:hypothetical protein
MRITVRVAEKLDEAVKFRELGFEYFADMTNGKGSGIVKIFCTRSSPNKEH